MHMSPEYISWEDQEEKKVLGKYDRKARLEPVFCAHAMVMGSWMFNESSSEFVDDVGMRGMNEESETDGRRLV